MEQRKKNPGHLGRDCPAIEVNYEQTGLGGAALTVTVLIVFLILILPGIAGRRILLVGVVLLLIGLAGLLALSLLTVPLLTLL